MLGAFVLCYAAWGHRCAAAARPRLARGWCVPIGLAGGAFSALFGTGGVLFAIYNAGRLTDATELRANNAAMILLSSLLRLVLFSAAGLLGAGRPAGDGAGARAGARCSASGRAAGCMRPCPRPWW